MYPGVKMYFVAPDVVRMKDDIKQYLTKVGVDWEEVDDLKVYSAIILLFQNFVLYVYTDDTNARYLLIITASLTTLHYYYYSIYRL